MSDNEKIPEYRIERYGQDENEVEILIKLENQEYQDVHFYEENEDLFNLFNFYGDVVVETNKKVADDVLIIASKTFLKEINEGND